MREDFDCPDEQKLTKALQKIIHINSRRWIEFLLSIFKRLDNRERNIKLSEEEELMLSMLHYTIWQEQLNKLGMITIKGSFLKIKESRELYHELKEILKINYEKIDFMDRPVDLGFTCPLDLHCTYSRAEILF